MDFDKQTIRKIMLEQRNKLTAAELEFARVSLQDTLYSIPEFISAEYVMAYMSFKHEFPTDKLIEDILAMGKKLVLPYTDAQMNIIAYQIDSDDELFASKLGIWEPNPSLSRKIDPNVIQMVIVPGVAFDRTGNRLGFGKGCYDKFLACTNSNCKKIGLCFDFQVVPQIPAEAHDIKMDGILTETGFVF